MAARFFRRRRRLFVVGLSIISTCLVYGVHRVLRDANEVDYYPFRDENDRCGRFESTSPYRNDPDHDFERRIDAALLAVQGRRVLGPRPDIPVKKIWQTWRDNAVPPEFDQPAKWRAMHPDWEHHVVSDQDASRLMADKLSTVPGLDHFFSSYPPILRADLLRYTLLWYHGGFYADIDVHPVRAIDSCRAMLPLFTVDNHLNVSLVIGIEVDEPYASARRRKFWRWDGTHGFIQYALYAPRPFSPVLRRAIVRSIAHSTRHEQERSRWYRPGQQFDRSAVLQSTGPAMFTEAVLDVLSETLPSDHTLKVAERNKDACPRDHLTNSSVEHWGNRVTWAPFYRLNEPLWIDNDESLSANDTETSGGLGVMPINVWGNGQRHSGSENFDSAQACINHHFSGTWKKSWLHRKLSDLFH